MTATWTILLVFAIGGPLDGSMIARAVYPSHAACIAAIKSITATLGQDNQSECLDTGILSASPFPKARPDGLGKGGANG